MNVTDQDLKDIEFKQREVDVKEKETHISLEPKKVAIDQHKVLVDKCYLLKHLLESVTPEEPVNGFEQKVVPTFTGDERYIIQNKLFLLIDKL